MIVDETNVKGEHVTRSVAQSHVLISTARGNMNNISSCLVKSTHVAFLVLIVNDHSLHGTRLSRVTKEDKNMTIYSNTQIQERSSLIKIL